MLRIVIYFLAVAGVATVLSRLADDPGTIVVNWQGLIWDTDVFQITILLALLSVALIFSWTLLLRIWQTPAAIGNFMNQRRERRGLEALSNGLIAIGAGDRALATKHAIQARTSLPNEPMTHLLRAQTAQLNGDRATSRRIFEAMLSSPDTEVLGLRGLFLEAECEGEIEAAHQFAERAVKLNPKLSWAVDSLFELQCTSKDWDGALATLAIAKKHGHIKKNEADRRRAVILAGQAQYVEDDTPEEALGLALEAHNLAPDLVPAAAVAARILTAKGNASRSSKIIQKTWKKSPHPELAVAYAYAQTGDGPKERLKRVQRLSALMPSTIESPIAVATAAIEAREFHTARTVLAPLLTNQLTQRVCTLMARIEDEDSSNVVGVREWLARAVNAPRDPVWTADGIISETWQPISPVTGALDAFQWRVPVEASELNNKELEAQKIEELVTLGVRPDAKAPDVEIPNIKPSDATAPNLKISDVETSSVKASNIGDKATEVVHQKDIEDDGATHIETALSYRKKPAEQEEQYETFPYTELQGDKDVTSKEGRTSDAVQSKSDQTAEDTEQQNQDKIKYANGSADPNSTHESSEAILTTDDDTKTEAKTRPHTHFKSKKSRIKADIFVPPRAPDDPGTDNAGDKP